MKLHGEFAISAFDLLLGGASSNAQDLVVIAFVRGGHYGLQVYVTNGIDGIERQ
jgi:hypothetical protein